LARQTTVEFVDDIDGGRAEETVQFGLDGKEYEIDLSGRNAARLRKIILPYVDVARRSAQATVRPASAPAAAVAAPIGTRPARVDREQTQAIRDWARGKGLEVSRRGRIPAEIVARFHAEL
jgi:hypothetical protein